MLALFYFYPRGDCVKTNQMRPLRWISVLALLTGLNGVAFAQATGTASSDATGGNPMASILMLGAFALIFYFMVFRPQSKRAKEHRELITKLAKGDEVLTTGGLLGKITKIDDNFFVIMIAEGVEVMVQKQAIAAALPKNTMKSISAS